MARALSAGAIASSSPSSSSSSPISTYAKEAAEELKEEGNKAVASKDWARAVRCYTEALERDPHHVALYSNRALARLKLGGQELLKALNDATHCVEAMPDWDRGWARKVSARAATRGGVFAFCCCE
jgi:small glutamine-rich tetratricopeptide repeat-containing protein alpha